MKIEVEGLEEAMRDLNKNVGQIKKKSQAGLWEAGLMIMRRAQQHLKASVVTGNLRASGYVRNNMDAMRPDPGKIDPAQNESIPTETLPPIGVEIGFTAKYALWVHEALGGRSPKFLERVIRQNMGRITKIVEERAKLDEQRSR